MRNWRPPEKFNPQSSHDIYCAELAAANFYFADHFWDKERFGVFSSVQGATLCRVVRVKPLGCPEVVKPGDEVDPDSWTPDDQAPWDWENRQKLYEKYRRSLPARYWGISQIHSREPWPIL